MPFIAPGMLRCKTPGLWSCRSRVSGAAPAALGAGFRIRVHGSGRNQRIVVRIVDEIWNDGNLDSVEELVYPDYLDGYGGPSGRERYRDLVVTVRAVFPDMHLAVEDLIGEGDKVVGRFTFRGTIAESS
jgi:hypothetical protein